jgi:DNA-directed RNA polymerase III subunit RPC2
MTSVYDQPEEKNLLVSSFVKIKGLVKHHLDSFNYFIVTEIKDIVKANQCIFSNFDSKFYLKYTDIYVGSPQLDENMVSYQLNPHDCRLRDLTYAAPIFVDIEYVRGKNIIVRKGVQIGRIPIMLRSSHCVLSKAVSDRDFADFGECPLDPGGYFIIRGSEKVILVQEQLSKNRLIIDLDRKKNPSASVTSSTHERKSKTSIFINSGRLFLSHNSLLEDIPVFIVLKSLGDYSDMELCTMISGNNIEILELLKPSLEECSLLGISSSLSAIEYISKRTKGLRKDNYSDSPLFADTRDVLYNVILAHIKCSPFSTHGKSLYLSFMIRRLLLTLKKEIELDDRDYVGNKRLELAGQLLSLLFEDIFKRFNNDLKKEIDNILSKQNRAQEFDAFKVLSNQMKTITAGFERAISTGNWNLKRFKMERAGITQVLSRLSYIAALGMMTRINSQFEKTRKVSGPRSLQTSQWGMLCPSDTPEGEACGLVKNLSLMTHVTTDSDETPIIKLIYTLGALDIKHFAGDIICHQNSYIISVNGVPMGFLQGKARIFSFVSTLRKLRRSCKIDSFIGVSVSHVRKSINISCDSGRICRPLLILNSQGIPYLEPHHLLELKNSKRTFDECIKDGLLEYIDVNEENDLIIAINEKDIQPGLTTHLEVEPYTLLGAVAGLVPYPHHNQSPRNTYQCAMGKQAMGAIGYNQMNRIDSLLYLLVYPQQPMVKTKAIELINYDRLPAGQNAIIAVMSYSGYDIEDALVLNKASLDRGFGRCIVMKKFTTNLKKYTLSHDRIVFPQPDALTGKVNSKFEVLDPDGLGAPGERLQNGYVYVNKQTPFNSPDDVTGGNKGEITFKNAPQIYRGHLPSFIDKVMITNTDDQILIKNLIRQTRRPELGDKFSSRHGQKGVCGLIIRPEDMPFSEISGIIPDIIMNPHGFPSRMTVGKMIELISGKAGLIEGRLHYGTAFGGSKVETVSKVLVENGYHYSGKEALISGITGKTLQVLIFFGPVYYQKLKHMVLDKMHSRARGPRAVLTRQPTEGRSRDGGLRLGEMERDCLIGYGASMLLIERLMISSDGFEVNICESCGIIGFLGWCSFCNSGQLVSKLKIPYACKLLFQELQSMNITPKIKLVEF